MLMDRSLILNRRKAVYTSKEIICIETPLVSISLYLDNAEISYKIYSWIESNVSLNPFSNISSFSIWAERLSSTLSCSIYNSALLFVSLISILKWGSNRNWICFFIQIDIVSFFLRFWTRTLFKSGWAQRKRALNKVLKSTFNVPVTSFLCEFSLKFLFGKSDRNSGEWLARNLVTRICFLDS